MSHDPVRDAQVTLINGRANLYQCLPTIIKNIIRKECWRERTNQDGKPFESFRDFCEYKMRYGLETPYEKMISFCEHDKECLKMLIEADSITSQKEKRNAEVIELRASGLTQQEIADDVGVSRSRVAEIVSENSESSAFSDTQQSRAKLNQISDRTQRKIDKLRKVSPILADACERKEIKVDTAMKQVGLIDRDPIKSTMNKLLSAKSSEQFDVVSLLIKESRSIDRVAVAKEIIGVFTEDERAEFLNWLKVWQAPAAESARPKLRLASKAA